ncbi:MAG: DUF3575 domain-containing protein, partial [Bacteroides sp.]
MASLIVRYLLFGWAKVVIIRGTENVNYDGYALGAGLTFGYVFALSDKWA